MEGLDSLRWVMDVTDALTDAERIHAAFHDAVFEGESIGGSEDEAPQSKRFVTRATEEERHDLRNDANDLLGISGEEEPLDGVLDFDNLEESEEEFGEGGFDPEFARWIGEDTGHMSLHTATGAHQSDDAIEAAIQHYPGLRQEYQIREPVALPTVVFNKRIVAKWVLHQLTQPGRFLSQHSIFIDAIRGQQNIDAYVDAVEFAIERMSDDGTSPAILMLHEQTKLAPLTELVLGVMLEDNPKFGPRLVRLTGRPFDEADALPSPSAAYCSESGRRMRPELKRTADGSLFLSHPDEFSERYHVIGADREDKVNPTNAVVIRKPCTLELGRLLWQVKDLYSQCRSYENARYEVVSALKHLQGDMPPAVGPDASATSEHSKFASLIHTLDEITFDSLHEAAAWTDFARIELQLNASRNDTGESISQVSSLCKLMRLGMEHRLHEFCLPPHHCQENVLSGQQIHSCKRILETPASWAQGCVHGQPFSAQNFMALCHHATVEQYAALPILRQKVFETYCSAGELIVTPTHKASGSSHKVKVFRIADILASAPHLYMDCLRDAQNGLCFVRLSLDSSKVAQLLDTAGIVSQDDSSEWTAQRRGILPGLCSRLVRRAQPYVHEHLLREGQRNIVATATLRFATLCAEGPYQDTTLAINARQIEVWDKDWNAVETIPQHINDRTPQKRFVVGRARVAAVYADTLGTTVFAFLDEKGELKGHMKWVNIHSMSVEGSAKNEQQSGELRRLCEVHVPHVFAVGASQSTDVYRLVSSFLKSTPLVNIPVAWVPVDVSRVFSWSVMSRQEMPLADNGLRTAVSVGRRFRNPLFELCRLFNADKDILRLPLGAESYPTSLLPPNHLYEAISREATLWVSSCGIDVNTIVKEVSPSSVLQFVAGFSVGGAWAFLERVAEQGGMVSKRLDQLLPALTQSLGQREARNASAALRVVSPIAPEETNGIMAQLLDATIIPLHRYTAVQDALISLTKASSATEAALIWLSTPILQRLRRTAEVVQNYVAGSSLRCRDLEFAFDQLSWVGDVHDVRRPFRRMTDHHFFRVMTGFEYAATQTGAKHTTSRQIIRQGDVLQCRIVQIRTRLGTTPHNLGIVMMASSGLLAFMPYEDITDPALLEEFQTRMDDPHCALDRLRKGTVVYGAVKGVQFARVQLVVRWAPGLTAVHGSDFDEHIAMDATQATSQRSVNTTDLTKSLTSVVTNASKHVLFRNVRTRKAEELLIGKDIGETIVRPSYASQDGREVIITVKAGDYHCIHISTYEEREESGRCTYRFAFGAMRKERQFSAIDHLLHSYVSPLAQKIIELRAHRKFIPRIEDVRTSLEKQATNAGILAYVIVEREDLEAADSRRLAGHYSIEYQTPLGKVSHRTIVVDAEGYYLVIPSRGLHFCGSTAEGLIAEFKKISCQRRQK